MNARRPLIIAIILSLLISACSFGKPAATGNVTAGVPAAAPLLFAVDTLVRSAVLPGIDVHLRYVERRGTKLTLHLAFYNNSPNDLAFVDSAALTTAQLRGMSVLTPTAVSPSFVQGIAPPGRWLQGGAHNGWLLFDSPFVEDEWVWSLPGFPSVPLRLTLPLQQAPDRPAPTDGAYSYANDGARIEGQGKTVVVRRATLTAEAMQLELGTPQVDRLLDAALANAVVFDGHWNQLLLTAAPTPADDGTLLDFARPLAGELLLLRLPGFPLIRIPLRTDEQPALATAADLPPSAMPRASNELGIASSPVSGSMAQPGGASQAVPVGIELVLERLNRALTQGDRAAFLASFVPELQASQGSVFDRTKSLPLVDVHYTFRPPDAVEAGLQTPTPDEYAVELRYAFRDAETTNSFKHEFRFSLRQDDVWRIAVVGGDLPFWAHPATTAERVGSFWLLYRAPLQIDRGVLTAELERSFAQVEQILPERTQSPYVMFITATADEFTTLTGRAGDRWAGAAVSKYTIDDIGVTITDRAFFLNGAAFAGVAATNREQTITHELTHLVLAPTTMPFMPAWLIEGAAMAVAEDFQRDLLGDDVLDRSDLQALTSETTFADHDDTLGQYAYSAFLARYLIEMYGMERFLQLYDAYSQTSFALIKAELTTTGPSDRQAQLGRLAQQITPGYLSTTLNIDLPTLERDFRDWLAKQAD